jgi:hypothetical protein
MKTIILSIGILIFGLQSLSALEGISPISSQQISMGQTCNSQQDCPMIMAANPALLSLVPGRAFSLNYQRLYNLSELDQISLAFSCECGFANLGIIYSNFGESGFFVHNNFSLAISKTVMEYLALGLRLDYERVSFDERFDALDRSSLALGIAYIHTDFAFHVALSELNNPRFSDRDRKTEPGYRVGLSFLSIKALVVNLETSGRKNGERRYHFGQEVQLEKRLYIRFGLVTNPTMPSGGLGLNLDRFSLDYAISSHNELGESHSLGMTVNF